MTRQLIVVDIETTGLHPDSDILEVAAVNVHTGEELYFVPFLPEDALPSAEPKALQINRYYERGVWEHTLTWHDTQESYRTLSAMLNGNTFAGSNPTFDLQRLPIQPVWHHRLADLAAYAAGVLGLPPTDLPGLDAVCAKLGVMNDERHSALGDARATAECFRELIELAHDAG